MEKNVQAFLKVFDPADNSTGGGTASAIAGAMAAALAGMVARLSVGKKDMEADEFYLEREETLTTIAAELFDGGWKDSEAFAAVLQAFRLSKESEEEKSARRQAIQAAWIQATEVPLANAHQCAEVLDLAHDLEGRSYVDAASDLNSALYLARAGLKGCLENVAINLPMIKDESIAAGFRRELESLQEIAQRG
jgi:formiminotetrahydrofolate cyclodeaminase